MIYLFVVMEDMLETIFKLQKELDYLVGFTKMNYQEQVNNNFMATIHEICELHDETNWKHWKKTKKVESWEKILEEYADILHFIVQKALLQGFTAGQIFDAYVKKNQVNRERVANNY